MADEEPSLSHQAAEALLSAIKGYALSDRNNSETLRNLAEAYALVRGAMPPKGRQPKATVLS